MKIKLMVLEKDEGYLKRFVSFFSTRYADKIELYSFTDPALILDTLEKEKIDVLLASDAFRIEPESLPPRCGFAYFVDSPDVETVYGQRAICKFQKAELIYKEVLSIYSENAGKTAGFRFSDDHTKMIAFTSPCGGVGTSTLAASCAVHFAKAGRKTLYLNLENFGSSDLFFHGQGQFDLSDVIFFLKSNKANLSLKVESCVRQDPSGVFYYSAPKIALDMMELKNEEILRMISEMRLAGSYDFIVFDLDFSLSEQRLDLLRTMDDILLVSDGSECANTKFLRAYQALLALEKEKDNSVLTRMNLVYNKFSNKTGTLMEGLEIPNIGGSPRYEHATLEQVMGQLCEVKYFDTFGRM